MSTVAQLEERLARRRRQEARPEELASRVPEEGLPAPEVAALLWPHVPRPHAMARLRTARLRHGLPGPDVRKVGARWTGWYTQEQAQAILRQVAAHQYGPR